MQKTASKTVRGVQKSSGRTAQHHLAAKTAALMEQSLSYFDSEDFRTLSRSELMAEPDWRKSVEPPMAAPPDTPPYLASLYEFPLLTREQEYVIFRKMNFLRYEAAELQRSLTLSRLSSRRVRLIETRLREAEDVRNRIMQCNLRLVVSIAKTLVDSVNSLDDLISDGNLPLLRAVEIFDFTRGLRFSTYATWAIRNGLYRATHRSRRHNARFRLDDADWLHQAVTPSEDATFGEKFLDEQALVQLVDQLDPRSQTILRDRFALSGQERPAKFRELAAKLRLSSERVRQLLERALGHLRELSVNSLS